MAGAPHLLRLLGARFGFRVVGVVGPSHIRPPTSPYHEGMPQSRRRGLLTTQYAQGLGQERARPCDPGVHERVARIRVGRRRRNRSAGAGAVAVTDEQGSPRQEDIRLTARLTVQSRSARNDPALQPQQIRGSRTKREHFLDRLRPLPSRADIHDLELRLGERLELVGCPLRPGFRPTSFLMMGVIALGRNCASTRNRSPAMPRHTCALSERRPWTSSVFGLQCLNWTKTGSPGSDTEPAPHRPQRRAAETTRSSFLLWQNSGRIGS